MSAARPRGAKAATARGRRRGVQGRAKPGSKPALEPAPRRAATQPAGERRHWLVKSDPDSYGIADLERDGATLWTGVRNFQARNTLRDEMAVGDPVLVYHSSADPMAIVGVAEVSGAARPDETAFDRKDDHYDPKSKRESPTWFAVELRYVTTFARPVTRERLAAQPALARMVLLQRGSRLSVQPVTTPEFAAILKLAR
ncbi:MAG TPA: EVE domain-containing protein [Planctomycetota bacterium]|nr:EVE domain-containing protein [Planctomycetota bacterium]